METLPVMRYADLELTAQLLRARERSLQHLAQSPRCTARVGAELELNRVRQQISAAYAQMRQFQAHG